MRTRQAYIEQTGGPEVIRWREVDLPDPGPGEVLVRHAAIGLNFIDTYHRSGLYPIPLPATLGLEAAGFIEAVGEGVANWIVGDTVATFGPSRAAYSDAQIVPATELFRVPEGIAPSIAAAALLKGLTAEMLAERVAPLRAGEWALVHAAAGGVGQLLVQWLAARGVRIIATAGTAEKCARALAQGAEVAFVADEPDLAARVRAATGGHGVRASYDGVGSATWALSLAATGRRGIIASFGNASGPVTGVNLGALAAAGSLFVSRPTLFDYYRTEAERSEGVGKLWSMIQSGKLTVEISQTYPLDRVEQAHRDLEARRTTGSTILLP